MSNQTEQLGKNQVFHAEARPAVPKKEISRREFFRRMGEAGAAVASIPAMQLDVLPGFQAGLNAEVAAQTELEQTTRIQLKDFTEVVDAHEPTKLQVNMEALAQAYSDRVKLRDDSDFKGYVFENASTLAPLVIDFTGLENKSILFPGTKIPQFSNNQFHQREQRAGLVARGYVIAEARVLPDTQPPTIICHDKTEPKYDVGIYMESIDPEKVGDVASAVKNINLKTASVSFSETLGRNPTQTGIMVKDTHLEVTNVHIDCRMRVDPQFTSIIRGAQNYEGLSNRRKDLLEEIFDRNQARQNFANGIVAHNTQEGSEPQRVLVMNSLIKAPGYGVRMYGNHDCNIEAGTMIYGDDIAGIYYAEETAVSMELHTKGSIRVKDSTLSGQQGIKFIQGFTNHYSSDPERYARLMEMSETTLLTVERSRIEATYKLIQHSGTNKLQTVTFSVPDGWNKLGTNLITDTTFNTYWTDFLIDMQVDNPNSVMNEILFEYPESAFKDLQNKPYMQIALLYPQNEQYVRNSALFSFLVRITGNTQHAWPTSFGEFYNTLDANNNLKTGGLIYDAKENRFGIVQIPDHAPDEAPFYMNPDITWIPKDA